MLTLCPVWRNKMNAKLNLVDIEYIIDNKNIFKEEYKKHKELKKQIENKQILYKIPFFFVGVVEFFAPLFLSIIFLNFLPSLAIIAIAVVSFCIYFFNIFENERTYIGSIFNYISQKKLQKKGIEKDSDLFYFLKDFYLSNKDIDEAKEYYDNIEDKYKKLFFERYSIYNYIYNRILSYIGDVPVEELKENKNKLSQIIAKADLDNQEVEYIKEELQYILGQERENRQKEILNLFEEDEKLEEVQRKESKNKVLLEI